MKEIKSVKTERKWLKKDIRIHWELARRKSSKVPGESWTLRRTNSGNIWMAVAPWICQKEISRPRGSLQEKQPQDWWY